MSNAPLIALVTGGGRGIGAAIATRLAADGHKLVICGRSESALVKHADCIGASHLRVDLADRDSTDAMILEVKATFGRVDILVNNAGIAESASLQSSTDDAWDRMMEVNAAAAFRLTRAFVPEMVREKFGRIVNIASNAGVSGYNYSSVYCASKHAVVGMTRALAVELARTGVTVNAICPGWVDTDLVHEATERISSKTGRTKEEAERILADMSPQKRIIQPREVAHLVSSLVHDSARAINGQALVIDGGQVLK